MRLDQYLTVFGITESRTAAKNAIQSGFVSVNGKTVCKPSAEVTDADRVIFSRTEKAFVSRGGLKLEGALTAFSIDVKNKLAIDVGASSGGFTDCLLQRGARCVLAVDAGSGQLSPKLREDKRVFVYENYNARYLLLSDFAFMPNLAVMDVSFISATLIIPSLYNVLDFGSDFVCLVKPQFEVGRALVGKGGIVKDVKARKEAVDKVIQTAEAVGFRYLDTIVSPITGGDGNVEFLVHFRKDTI